MANGLIDTAAKTTEPDDRRIYGTAVAQVVDNCDNAMMGRVRLRLPWLPGYEPWARVATLAAGSNRGAFFIPKKGDQVLVSFNHGDVREPFVMGSVWNGKNGAPADSPHDADNVWIIRTAKKHEIVFDDDNDSISIKSSGGQRVKLTKQKIEISMDEQGTTSVTLDSNGDISVKAKQTLTLEGDSIVIKGSSSVSVSSGNGPKLGSGRVEINGGAQCTIDAEQINIG